MSDNTVFVALSIRGETTLIRYPDRALAEKEVAELAGFLDYSGDEYVGGQIYDSSNLQTRFAPLVNYLASAHEEAVTLEAAGYLQLDDGWYALDATGPMTLMEAIDHNQESA